jgi:5-dehydro-4-deoxyglucarate dehydratase
VDAVLAFAYPFACADAEGAYQYLQAIANSVRIGVLAYPCAKGDFWPAVLQRLAQLPNVIGFKDPSDGVQIGKTLGALIPDDFLWIAEGEGHAEKALPAGARAYTSAVATFVPNACHEFWKYGVAGKVDRMKEVHKARIEPIVKLRGIKPGYGVSGIKVALEALGRAGGPVRPPGTQVEAADRAAIANLARKHAEKS